MIFIHGAGGQGELWTRQKGVFSGSLTPDLVGHPRGVGRDRIQDYASWLNEYRIQMNLSRVCLVGHSMGGAIALQMALFFPYAVSRLVLLSTGAALKVSSALLTTIKEDYRQGVTNIVEYAFHAPVDRRIKKKSFQEMMKTSSQVTYGDFIACSRFDIREEVKQIQIPTLILVGEEDRMTPVKYSRFLASNIEGSTLQIIPEAGHMLMLEKYQEVNSSIKRFLGKF